MLWSYEKFGSDHMIEVKWKDFQINDKQQISNLRSRIKSIEQQGGQEKRV